MPAAPHNILAIRLSSIGDIVHALPAVSALGETYPQAEITWAIERRYASLLEGNPYVKRVIGIDTLGWRKHWTSLKTIREISSAIRALREQRYDAVIDFQGLIKTGLMSWLCRSPRRIGYARFPHREPGAGFFYTEEAPVPGPVHVIQENMALVERLCARASTWRFPLPRNENDEKYAESSLAAIGDFILVSPGGGWIAKRWPPASYADLLTQITRRPVLSCLTVVLTGSAAEEEDIRRILESSGNRRAYYIPATLGQYIALARRARLFIGGDTGPMHLAAALGVPVVAIMGPTDPLRNGPFSPLDITLSNHAEVNHTRRGKSPAFLQGISVEDVAAAAEERLARAHAR